MSKTGDLIEKYVLEELKFQINDSNSNAYLSMYGVIAGAIFLHIREVYLSLMTLKETEPFWFFMFLSLMFFFSITGSVITIVLQCLRPRMPSADKFAPNRDALIYESEERARVSVSYYNYVLSEELDKLIYEIVRLRLIECVNKIISEYQNYNKQKRWLQRVTALLLLMAIVSGGVAIMRSTKPPRSMIESKNSLTSPSPTPGSAAAPVAAPPLVAVPPRAPPPASSTSCAPVPATHPVAPG